MNETMIYELKNLMKNTKVALEIAHYMGELPTFVEELNRQADASNMSIQYMLMPMVEVTSNYIISGEARKAQKNVAELATSVMGFMEYFGLNVDIQLTDPSNMTFAMFFFNDEQLILEITA